MNIVDKIQKLRALMKVQGVNACIIPSTDPHLSEYPASHWESRKWISGFTGSAGTVVITAEKAGLWTDSRYFLQAEEQLTGSGIQLFKDGLPGVPNVKSWLAQVLPSNSTIGIENTVFSASDADELKNYFSDKNIRIDTGFAPLNDLWDDRPVIPENKIFNIPENLSGASANTKIKQTLEALQKEGANTTILGTLDAIAWIFNIRGNDVEFNPVAVSYALVSDKETVLFIHPQKLNPDVSDYLKKEGVVLAEYNKITDYIKQLPEDRTLLINPAKINSELYEAIPSSCKIIQTSVHPVDQLKGIKNETEIAGFRKAMKKDGVALVKFQMWLEKALKNGEKMTELDISKKLLEYRSQQALFFGESFNTIAGYAEHGAIVHYSATKESNATIQPKGLLLVDSGAQYFDGTTDITRTFALGEVSEAMKKDYTAVLKGNINLAQAQFPKGTKGVQLDILARKALWENGANYMHGTGHGVGHFLNVHEGPQSIRMDYNPMPLCPGMITSNEPGIYRTNEYGIRIENLILTVKAEETVFGEFYQFETLTLCPIDKKAINKSLLLPSEIKWLNDYHQKVYTILSPELTTEEQIWLKEKTDEM